MDIINITKILAPFIANLIGWINTAGADGKYEKYEIKSLIKSLIRQTAITVLGVVFLQEIGIDIDLLSGFVGGALVEIIYVYAAKLTYKAEAARIAAKTKR